MAFREEVFQDRREAGRVLARAIQASAVSLDCQDGIVLGLPRGGVPVAYEVARALDLPLDIVVVRKLGVPGFGELAMGAVASDGTVTINQAVLEEYCIPAEVVDAAVEREKAEIELGQQRNGRPPAPIEGRMAILVDDGLATGASMLAAARAVRPRARKVLVAVPVATQDTCDQLRDEVDHIICARVTRRFHSVGSFYQDFAQTTDEEVGSLLAKAANEHGDRVA
jgi:predicted phosphoribosyltransferase